MTVKTKFVIIALTFISVACFSQTKSAAIADSTLIGKKIFYAIKTLKLDTNFNVILHAHRIHGLEITFDSIKVRLVVPSITYVSKINPNDPDSRKKRNAEKLKLVENKKIICITTITKEKTKTIGDCN